MGFFEGGVLKLAKTVLFKQNPAYVQFYVTARCNLACEQCNIIYAHADQREATLEEIEKIAFNLSKLGTSVVLLTGGEPFIRKDLPEIAAIFLKHKIHPRIQTNGLATLEQLKRMKELGVHDVSISLDSLAPTLQDKINGGFDHSWDKALTTMSNVNNTFPQESFAALGCVLAPSNIDHVCSVIKFATKIGWWVSLVPAHVADKTDPRGFSTFDKNLEFNPKDYPKVKEVIERAKKLRDSGENLYDSDEYLDDIYRFITKQPIQWRRRNNNKCDSPNLYFVVQPNGSMSVCCDYKVRQEVYVQDDNFIETYKSKVLRKEIDTITSACTGCMYGSFPEITISSRFYLPMVKRGFLFLTNSHKRKLQKYSPSDMHKIAQDILREEGLE